MSKRYEQEPNHTALVSRHGMPLADALRATLADAPFPAVKPSDAFILARGYPVVPWIPFKPAELVWYVWLGRLNTLYRHWTRQEPNNPDVSEWSHWCSMHLRTINARRPESGCAALASAVGSLRTYTHGKIHVVGHSVGALASVYYLDHLRHCSASGDVPIGSVIALDAASTGLSLERIRYVRAKRDVPYGSFVGLGAWATAQRIGFIEISNASDWWSYGRISDGPFLSVRSVEKTSLRKQLDGTIHDQIRRSPVLAEYLWQPKR